MSPWATATSDLIARSGHAVLVGVVDDVDGRGRCSGHIGGQPRDARQRRVAGALEQAQTGDRGGVARRVGVVGEHC